MAEAQHDGRRRNRPISVTLVLLGVLSIGLANGWRALGLFRQSELLLALGATPDPRLCALVAIFWALVFVGLTWALWRRRRYLRFLAPIIVLAFGIFEMLLPGPCARADQFQVGWPLTGILYLAFLFLVGLALNSRAGRAYFADRGTRAGGLD